MGIIHVQRIGQKLLENYGQLINMDDYKDKLDDEKDKALRSRAVAACAIYLYTGASVQSCADAITDGFKDRGIDAIYNELESKVLYIVQSKWIADGNGAPSQGDILKFIAGVKRILELDFSDVNSKLASKLTDVDTALMDSDYKLHLLIAYTGSQKLSEEVRSDLDDLMKSLNDTSDVIQYSEVSQKHLYDIISGGADASPINIDDIDLRDWGRQDSPYLTYYGNMSAATLAEWWENYGNRLFAKNLRFYKGASDTNEGMMKTLREEPKNFWYFNNGIKILCESFAKKPIYGDDRSVGLFTAKGVSIVNGAQTVGCIGAVGKTNMEKLQDAKVHVQFISLDNAPAGYDIQVTKLSNTQNKIDGRDFAALDPEQERIRRDLWMDGVTYLYKGNIKSTNDNEVSVDEAVIGLACYQSDIKLSTLAKRNSGAFFEDISKPPYTTLFNEKTSSILLVNVIREIRLIDDLLSNRQKKTTGKDRQILVHGNRFIAYCIMQLQLMRDSLYQVQTISNLRDDINAIIDRILPRIAEGIIHIYPDNYLNSLFKNNQKCSELFKFVQKAIANE